MRTGEVTTNSYSRWRLGGTVHLLGAGLILRRALLLGGHDHGVVLRDRGVLVVLPHGAGHRHLLDAQVPSGFP